MPFNSNIDRTDAGALIPEDVAREIIQGVPEASAVMRMARRLPNLTRAQQRMPVLSTLPSAYFVNGDSGLKQSTTMAWANKYLNVEEIAVYVPIPDAVLDDADYNIWSEVRPRIVEAIGVKFDAAVLIGTDAPASWPDDLVTACTAAGSTVSLAAFTDLYDAELGEGGVVSKVEEDGFMVNGHIADLTMKAKLRGLRDADGQPIFLQSMQQAATSYTLDGSPIDFVRNGAMSAATALQISGDWSQLVYAIRQDLTWKVIDQGVITDNAGQIIYNLPQQDMVALRAVMRIAWQVPNPINRVNSTEATRFPFAALTA